MVVQVPGVPRLAVVMPGKADYPPEEPRLTGGGLRRWPWESGDLCIARPLVGARTASVRGGARGRELRRVGLLCGQPYPCGQLRVARRLVRGGAAGVGGIGRDGKLRSPQNGGARLKPAVFRVIAERLPLRVKSVFREPCAVSESTPPGVDGGRQKPRQGARCGVDLGIARSLTAGRSHRVGAGLLTR